MRLGQLMITTMNTSNTHLLLEPRLLVARKKKRETKLVLRNAFESRIPEDQMLSQVIRVLVASSQGYMLLLKSTLSQVNRILKGSNRGFWLPLSLIPKYSQVPRRMRRTRK